MIHARDHAAVHCARAQQVVQQGRGHPPPCPAGAQALIGRIAHIRFEHLSIEAGIGFLLPEHLLGQLAVLDLRPGTHRGTQPTAGTALRNQVRKFPVVQFDGIFRADPQATAATRT